MLNIPLVLFRVPLCDDGHLLENNTAESASLALFPDSEHHVRHGVGPERERGGHGEEDRPAGDQAGDSAE